MEFQHFNAKVHLEGNLPVEPARFIDVFHRWIQEKVVGELVLDVADYRHVPNGPGVMLIGQDADYAIDQADGQYGLLYNRKAAVDGSNPDRMRQALAAAATACRLLEDELAADGLKFSRVRFELMVNDRGWAPNTPETYAVFEPQLESFLADVVGGDQFKLELHDQDRRRRVGATITCDQPVDFDALAG